MKKDYQSKDLFLSEDGKDLFELQSSAQTKHICITDEAEEIENINETKSSANIDQLTEIVVGLGDEIPLWRQHVTLKWKFNPLFNNYSNSDNVKNYIRVLFSDAVSEWGDASPVKFEESTDIVDFEIIMRPDNCNANGCTLASAFFPNSNLNILTLYPKMFSQNRNEQVETMIHEIGHIFGLRHYFAKEKEASWRSEVFGHHYPLTIMNYGHQSTLTPQDKIDLKRLYALAWSGQITNLNGINIKLYYPLTQP